MKKLFLLTSIIALAACGGGGGSGGGNGGGVAPMDLTIPDGVRSAVSSEVAASNSSVTSMKSEILVATKGGVSKVVRASTPVMNGSGVTFISYDLSDVKLRPADYNVPENAYLKIGVNAETGAVEHMTMVMGELENGEQIGGALARVADSSAGNARFNGPIFEYVKDKYAKVQGSEFSVADYSLETMTGAMQNALANAYGLSGGEWEQQSSGDWKYKNADESYAEHDGMTISISNNTGAMEDAIKDAYSFDDGKWTTIGGVRKYIEYGDSAEYRIADDGNIDETDLAGLVTSKGLPALGHWNRVDETMEVVSLGGDAGLQYSDFGHFNPVYSEKRIDLTTKGSTVWNNVGETKTNTEEEMEDEFAGKDYQLFAGGYAISGTTLKDTLEAPRNTTFTGRAIGRVYASIHSNTGGVDKTDELTAWNAIGDGHDMAMDYTTSNAKLVVGADGKETLTMPFTGFYTVKVEKSGNGAPAFTFTDTGNAMASSAYRMNNNPDPESIDKAFRPGYYGVGTASEAAGTVYYKSEQDIGIDSDAGKVNREWEFQGAYGLKK